MPLNFLLQVHSYKFIRKVAKGHVSNGLKNPKSCPALYILCSVRFLKRKYFSKISLFQMISPQILFLIYNYEKLEVLYASYTCQ